MITLQMAQQLKTKNINVVPGQLFCCQCKVKFLLERDSLHQDKFRSLTDTDNEFTECQASRKKLQLIGISLVSLHAFTKTLKSNISEAYKVQKQPPRGGPRKRCSENIQKIYRRTPMPKCDFNNVA